MRTFKKGSAAWLFAAMGLAVGLTLNGCGGSSGGSTTAASADSLSDLPATSTLVTGGSASASISAKSVGKAAAGTPPLLKDISSSNIDTYFWNGLLATLYSTDVSAITEAQSTAYWQGEGACRMAQAVGYAFQNISTGAISLCYMQNAPLAANGVSITSGSATATNIFDQAASNRVVKVVEKAVNHSRFSRSLKDPRGSRRSWKTSWIKLTVCRKTNWTCLTLMVKIMKLNGKKSLMANEAAPKS